MSKLISTNPSRNYEKIGSVDISTKSEIQLAVAAARSALSSWTSLGVKKRINLLRKVRIEFSKHKKELAKLASQEMGMPITDSLFDIDDGLDNYLKWYLDNGEKAIAPETTYKTKSVIHEFHYEPTGVAAVIAPWNFPMSNWVWSVVPHLVIGNTVVFKHSEECPLFSKKLEQIISECGLPKGVITHVLVMEK